MSTTLRRRLISCAASVLIAGALYSATPAAATFTPGVGSSVSATTPAATLGGSFITCAISLHMSVISSGAVGAGGDLQITSGSATNCGFGRSMTMNFSTPWRLSFVPTSADASAMTMTNVDLTVTVFGASCHYRGTLNGTASDSTDTLSFSNAGGLILVSGGSACLASPPLDMVLTTGQNIKVD